MANQSRQSKSTPGLRVRHSRSCGTVHGGRCDCRPAVEAWVWSRRDQRKIRRTFSGKGALSAAKAWRRDAGAEVARGRMRAPTRLTLRDAWARWIEQAEAGEVLSRFKRPYKPSALRGYRADMDRYVLPDLGGLRLADVTADDLQALVERLNGQGLSGSKTRNVIVPMMSLYRKHRREVPVDPTDGLDLPEPGGRRERAASPAEAAALLAALPDELRPLYATAFYAGLRRGELRGLRWSNVSGVLSDKPLELRVTSSWDDVAGEIEPKSIKGARTVACPELLRPYIETHLLATGRGGSDLVFGRTASEPFTPSHVRRMAAKAWAAHPELEPIGLHECRHTYVSLMAAAGVPLERIGDYVGHASSYMTDKYRHLLEGQGAADAARLDEYVNGGSTGAHTGAHDDGEE